MAQVEETVKAVPAPGSRQKQDWATALAPAQQLASMHSGGAEDGISHRASQTQVGLSARCRWPEATLRAPYQAGMNVPQEAANHRK